MERDKYSSNRQLSPVRGGRPTSHGPRHHSPPVNGLPSRHLSPPRPPRPRSRTPRSRSPRLRDKRIYDRSPQDSGGYRRDGSREYSPDRKSLPPRSKDYAPPRSPRTREYSRSRSPGPPPREYDRGSHHSVSTNRRHFSPRQSVIILFSYKYFCSEQNCRWFSSGWPWLIIWVLPVQKCAFFLPIFNCFLIYLINLLPFFLKLYPVHYWKCNFLMSSSAYRSIVSYKKIKAYTFKFSLFEACIFGMQHSYESINLRRPFIRFYSTSLSHNVCQTVQPKNFSL